jgi:hypothetical protein
VKRFQRIAACEMPQYGVEEATSIRLEGRMLRSILIGFALAALLQVGVNTAPHTLASTSLGGSWASMECSAAALVRFVTHSFTAQAR